MKVIVPVSVDASLAPQTMSFSVRTAGGRIDNYGDTSSGVVDEEGTLTVVGHPLSGVTSYPPCTWTVILTCP